LVFAVQLLERVVAFRHPYYGAFALSLLVQAYRNLGKADLEMHTVKRVTELPDDQKVLLDPRWAASCYEKVGDIRRAKQVLVAAISLAPDDPDSIAALTEICLFDGSIDEALAHAQKLERRPEPKYQVLGKIMKAFALAYLGKHGESHAELLWVGQYLVSVGGIPADTWDYRDLEPLLSRMGPNARVAKMILDALSKRMSASDFAREWGAASAAVP